MPIFITTLSTLLNLLILSPELTSAAPSKKNLIKSVPKEVLLNEIFILRPIDQHHFNTKAPNRCGDEPPLSLSPREMKCQITQLPKGKKVILTTAICDDPESFCQVDKHTVEVKGKGNSFVRFFKSLFGKPKQQRVKKSKKVTPTGFIDNDPKRALEMAQPENRLLLIDFYGIWCPPCNLLDEFVFEKPEFQKATKNFVKVALDADATLSWEWKSHFRVGGYPTVIVADSQLREIGRFVGFRPLQPTLTWLQEQQKFRFEPLEEVKKRPNKNPTQTIRIARWHLEKKEYDEAKEYLKNLDHPEAEKLHLKAQIQIAKQNDRETHPFYLRLLQKFPKDVDWSQWVLDLLHQNEKSGHRFAQQALKSIQRWRNSPKREELGILPPYLDYREAKIHEFLGQTDQAKKAYARGAKFYESYSKKSHLKISRGANIELAYFLMKAGRKEESRKLYEQLIQEYPEEFTFNFNYARVLDKLGKTKEAIEYAQKSVEHSYGDNWLRAVALEAKLLGKTGQKDLAQKKIQEALQTVRAPKTSAVRTHRYIAQLRATLEEMK